MSGKVGVIQSNWPRIVGQGILGMKKVGRVVATVTVLLIVDFGWGDSPQHGEPHNFPLCPTLAAASLTTSFTYHLRVSSTRYIFIGTPPSVHISPHTFTHTSILRSSTGNRHHLPIAPTAPLHTRKKAALDQESPPQRWPAVSRARAPSAMPSNAPPQPPSGPPPADPARAPRACAPPRRARPPSAPSALAPRPPRTLSCRPRRQGRSARSAASRPR